ncbi:DUF2798 domain-containing protein [Arenibacterium sp. CAU 1754]
MLPARFAPVLFSLFVSGFMSCVVSGISTLRVLGLSEGFFGAWMSSWTFSWAVAFPVIFFVAPLTRKLVERMVKKPGQGA